MFVSAGRSLARGFGRKHVDFRHFHSASNLHRSNRVGFSSANGCVSVNERFWHCVSTTRFLSSSIDHDENKDVSGTSNEPESPIPRQKRTSPARASRAATLGGGNLLTVIEPTVRRKPFQNFGPKRDRAKTATPKNTTKRIFVDSIGGDQDLFGSPIKSTGQHGSYPVIAIQVARSIDLSKVFASNATKGVRKMRERLSVVAQLPPSGHDALRFVAVFRFGSVVFFNVSPKDIARLVEEIKSISTGILSHQRKDRFCVHVQPPQTNVENNIQDEVTPDYCIVPELNMKSVDVISNVMAQSVALDSFNDTVDELLADFETINTKVTLEGNLTPVDRKKMFRAVAQNNSIFLKLTRVGIKDRNQTAWNLSQYETVSEGMREEFDIDRRFEHIEFKLNLIQENAKFFLEVLANQKSDSLEWIIIVLILLECVLMCIEMSGMGEPLFAYLGEFWPSP